MEVDKKYNLYSGNTSYLPSLKLLKGDGQMSPTNKILLIDDSEPQRLYYQKEFERLNYSVDACSNTEEAIQKLEKENNVFLIVADINMSSSGISGLSFARRYQDLYPTILISDEHSVIEAKEEGFVTMIKTVEDKLLTNKINKCLNEFSKIRIIYDTKSGLQDMKIEVLELKTKIEDHSKDTGRHFDEVKNMIANLQPSIQHAEDKISKSIGFTPVSKKVKHANEIKEIFNLVEKLMENKAFKSSISYSWKSSKFIFNAWKKILLLLLGIIAFLLQEVTIFETFFKKKVNMSQQQKNYEQSPLFKK